jgi:hypothetical protein
MYGLDSALISVKAKDMSWSGPLRYIPLGAQGLVIARDIAVSQLFMLWALLEGSVRRLPRGWARQLYRNFSLSIFLRSSRHDLDSRVRYMFRFLREFAMAELVR